MIGFCFIFLTAISSLTSENVTSQAMQRDASCYEGKTDRDCCSSSNKCGEGGGDCDSDSHCKSGLVCGSNNCREFNSQASKSADCCMKKGVSDCYKGKTDRDCCSSSNKCGVGGGDCDSDSDCKSGHVCGINNCRDYNKKADRTADCCMKRGNKSCYKGRTDRDCCTSSNKCGIGGGDCDSDSDCESGLVCGTNNCRSFNNEASSSADCCMEKRSIQYEWSVCPTVSMKAEDRCKVQNSQIIAGKGCGSDAACGMCNSKLRCKMYFDDDKDNCCVQCTKYAYYLMFLNYDLCYQRYKNSNN